MEILDILNEEGNIIGTEERKIVHEKGLWHIHVGIWIMNMEGKLLFQKRSFNKKGNPGKWTRTGGHVATKETPLEGIQREVQEEIGVTIPQDNIELINIEKMSPDEHNRHFTYNYFVYVDYKIKDYKIQKEEVSDLKYMTIEEIEQIKNDNDENYTFVKWDNFDEKMLFLKKKRELILSKNNIIS